MKKVDAFGYITICNSIDTVRISAIFEIDDPTNFSMGNLTIIEDKRGTDSFTEENKLFTADSSEWIKDILYNSLKRKDYSNPDALECRQALKKSGCKRKDLIYLIEKAKSLNIIQNGKFTWMDIHI